MRTLYCLLVIATVLSIQISSITNDVRVNLKTPGYDGPDSGGGSGGGGSGGGSGGGGSGGSGGGSGGSGGGSSSGEGTYFDWYGTDGGAYYPSVGGGFGDTGDYACYYNYTLYSNTTRCHGAMDVVFLIDSSSSISDSDYKLAVNFVKDIISNYYLAPNFTQVAILEFSTDVRVLQELTWDACLLRKALDTPRITGSTNIKKAIDVAHELLKNSRKDIPDQIILITDGYQTVYPGHNCEVEVATCNQIAIDAANDAKADDIQIYAVGVGDASYYEDVLRQIASPPSDEYFSLATDYTKLNALKERLQNATCPVVLRVEPGVMCNEEMPKRILFVGHGFPSSDSISLLCQFGDFPTSKAIVVNQTHLYCDGPKLVDRAEWNWLHTANFVWNGGSDVDIKLYYNGQSIVQNDVYFKYASCPDYSFLIWVFIGLVLVAVLLGVLMYVASHSTVDKKELPVRSSSKKPKAPPKPEHGGQIDLSMMGV